MIQLDIITVCYNSAPTIRATLESVRRNSRYIKNFIIVDGGSKDETIKIIKEFSDIVTTFISEKDEGISDAFNKGIQLATSDYILILNSDDELYRNNLALVLESIDLSADLISTQIVQSDKKGKESFYTSNINLVRYKTSVFHPGLIVKRSVYSDIGLYNKTYKVGMDYDFITRCFINGKRFQNIKFPLVKFSINGISNTNPIIPFLEGMKIRKKYYGSYFNIYDVISYVVIIKWIVFKIIKLKR